MRVDARWAGLLAVAVSLSGCIGAMAPTVPVMPGPGKPFDAFNADQAMCRQYADAQIAPLRDQANNQTVGSALLGTALGAGLGAAVGGGRGAAIGAASGAVVGTGIGGANAQWAGMSLQQQYDVFFSQCMYARGNQVPGFAPGQYPIAPYPGAGAPVPPPRY
ncbi:MAG: glycine zipper family protein [Alphaproteobacteria bacterium]|nr:glycine zipper family protein [Alphaproteobacteria bacterium]